MLLFPTTSLSASAVCNFKKFDYSNEYNFFPEGGGEYTTSGANDVRRAYSGGVLFIDLFLDVIVLYWELQSYVSL